MSVARITEVSSSSSKSFDHAIKDGIKRACETLKNVKSAWVCDQEVLIDNDEIIEYRVKMKITFVLQ
jgi:flavin-binding protein dodecin